MEIDDVKDNWLDQPTNIRKGEELDAESLEKFLKKEFPEWKGELTIQQFPSGYSNLTYLLKMGEKQLVLRRPPFGADIKSAHDMGREYKILQALSKSYSKVPHPYIYAQDKNIIGAPFYIMERVEGVILRSKMAKEMIPDATTMSGIANSFVDTFVELHNIDYKEIGLGELGRPEGYIERQINGWTKRYFKSKTDEIPLLEKTAQWLNDTIPNPSVPTLIHNDFKYDNLVLHKNDWTKVIAVLDWEMCTVGDPLMDLGTSLGYWVNPNDPDWMKTLALSPTISQGNPTRNELVEKYIQKSGRDIENLVFYYVYGIFKVAVIAQQIYARYKKGLTQDPRFANLIEAIQGFGTVATQAIMKNRIDDLY